MPALENLIMSAEVLRGAARLEGGECKNGRNWLLIAMTIAAAVVAIKPWDKPGDEDERVVERVAEGDEVTALDKVRPFPAYDCDPEGIAAATRDAALNCCRRLQKKWDPQPLSMRPESVTDVIVECIDVPTGKVCANDAPRLNDLAIWCKRVKDKI